MKIKGIEKYFKNREKSLEDERKTKYSETFYTELFFICLYEIDANLYSKLIILKENQENRSDELFLESFFKENLSANIYKKLILKVNSGLSEIFEYKKDIFIPFFDDVNPEFEQGLLTRNLQKVPIYKTNNMEKIKKIEEDLKLPEYNGELKRKIRFIE